MTSSQRVPLSQGRQYALALFAARHVTALQQLAPKQHQLRRASAMSAPAPSDAPAATKPLASHKRPAEAPADGDADAAARAVPFADASPALQPSDGARRRSAVAGHTRRISRTPRPRPVHVLLADDEKISRLVTSKLLRQCVPPSRGREPCPLLAQRLAPALDPRLSFARLTRSTLISAGAGTR